jgi:hypothetical protein
MEVPMRKTGLVAALGALLFGACVAPAAPAAGVPSEAPPATSELAAAPGCGTDDVTLPPPREAATRRTGLIPVSILANAQPTKDLPQEVAKGIPLARVPDTYGGQPIAQVTSTHSSEDASATDVIVFYGDVPITKATTVGDIYANGGAAFAQHPTRGATGQHVIDVVGKERASLVPVGSFGGALTHTDEVAPGVRAWAIFWSDGVSDFSFTAEDDPDAVVGFARSLVCKG